MFRRLSLVLSIALGACGDPAHDDKVDSLGPEAPGVSPGPLHRPGQPCVVCHNGKGPGEMVLSLAGTLYQYPGSTEPLANAIVRFVDHAGATTFTGTNCAGNFFVQKADYDPTFPVWVSVAFGAAQIDMSTPIFRDGSCAKCHSDPAGEDSLGHVYAAPDGYPLPGGSCP